MMTLNESSDLVLNNLLQGALEEAQKILLVFGERSDYIQQLEIVFGNNNNIENDLAIGDIIHDFVDQLISFRNIEIRSGEELNGAYAAFSWETNTIYISSDFLLASRDNVQQITSVVLEEIGHYIDSQINIVDRPGDEGAAFSAVVQNVDLDQAALYTLSAEDDSAVIELDGQQIEVEQATAGINPAFDLIGLTRMRNDPRFAGIDGSGFSVAVIDTGLDASHPLIQPNFTTFVDFVGGRTTPFDAGTHGTHVAGTVGARDENIGVAPDVDLIGLQVFQSFPGGLGATVADQVEALDWVLQNYQRYNIVAVNMSLGSGFYTSAAELNADPRIQIINQLEQVGVTVVSAAGNDYEFKDRPINSVPNQEQNVGAPAIFSTLFVGAVWQDGESLGAFAGRQVAGADRLTVFSQRLNAPNMLFAPGAMINSTVPRGRFEFKAGTSMASPHVAGVVALMQEAAFQFGGRLLDPSEIVSILRTTANSVFDGDDEADIVRNTNISYPRINVFRAVEEIYNRFQQIGGDSGDPNGTIQGAFLGPTLTGAPVTPVFGSIGTDGGTVQVGNTDVDIIRFEVLSPGTVTLEVASNSNNRQDFDSILRLFNQNGTQLAFSDDDGVGTFSKIDIFLNPGVYYAGVSGFSNDAYNPNVAGSGVSGATGNYELQFSLNNADPNGLISGAVDVRLGSSRDPLVFNGSIGADYGAPVGVADVDLFRIVVPDNGTLLIDIDTPFDIDFVDSFLRLFDENGNELFFPGGDPFESDDDLSFDRVGNPTEFTDARFPGLTFEDPIDRQFFQGHTTDSFLGALVERGEVYYIGVSDFFNQDYNPTNLNGRLDSGAGGSYQLIVEFVNNDLNGSIDQAISTTTLPITNQPGFIGFDGDPVTGNLLEVGDKDVDFVKIRSATAGILEIDIDSFANPSLLPSGTSVDTVVLVFDSDGNLLAENDDADSLDPLLRLPIVANTDYFVAVTGFGNDNFDPFALGSGSSGDTGEYIFNSRLLPTSSSALFTDNAIQNPRNIIDVTLNSEVFGNIGLDGNFVVGATDIDLYRFTATTSERVAVRAAASLAVSPEENSADTFLRIFDANGNEIAFNNDESSSTLGSFVEFSATVGQEYYIGVNGFSGQARNYNPLTGDGAAPGSQGTYVLTISPGSNAGNDRLIGGPGRDRLVGGPGNDRLSGRGGNDRLVGGPGNDRLVGGPGNDRLLGGSGRDRLVGNAGNDRLVGSAGNDTLLGGTGNDTLAGGGGNDRALGAGGRDRLLGGLGNDTLNGGGDRDRLLGATGRDRLNGQRGNDVLRGGGDRDVLNGGSGNDRLSGDLGNDVIITGAGNDRIIIRQGQGVDRVRDFTDNQDKIVLVGINFGQLTIQQQQNDVRVSLGSETLLVLQNVARSQITQADFV
ncbi:MAG: S8 family serine peptidase [Cyanobacteria bacterium J06638_20]